MVGDRWRGRLAGFERRELMGLAALALLVVGGGALWYVRSLPSRVQVSTSVAQAPVPGPPGASPVGRETPPAQEVVVDVAGWVRRPGVYRLHQGDRVVDAIRQAGGARPGADLTSLNLAALLTDGEQVLVGRPGAAGSPVSGTSTGSGSSGGSSGPGVVNVNTATLDELETLPGIGEVLGQRIIDYREQHGPFTSVEDLLNVSGIGDQRLQDLKSSITV